MPPMEFLDTSSAQAEQAPRTTSGAGNNPSTMAGLIVFGAVLVLLAARSSFKRYM